MSIEKKKLFELEHVGPGLFGQGLSVQIGGAGSKERAVWFFFIVPEGVLSQKNELEANLKN